MWAVRAALILILIIGVIAFAYNNFGPEQTVDVHLQPLLSDWQEVPLVTVVFWAFVGGVVLPFLLFITTYIKLSLQIHSMKKRIKSLDSEVTILRNRPVEESASLLSGLDDLGEEAKPAMGEVPSDG